MQLDTIQFVRTKYKQNFAIYSYDDIISASLRLYGEYQQIELDFISTLIPYGTVIYDIGSNIGYHASAFATMTDRVYCFEAHPQHFELLKFNVETDTCCKLFHCAVSDQVGTANITTFDLHAVGNYGTVSVNNDGGFQVPMTTIDSITAAGDIAAPGFVKIDVEGHEPQVLRGARETIAKNLPILYIEAQDSKNTPETYSILDEHGYSMSWICVRNYHDKNFNGNTENVFGNDAIFSILAVPPDTRFDSPYPLLGADDTWEKFVQRLRDQE